MIDSSNNFKERLVLD